MFICIFNYFNIQSQRNFFYGNIYAFYAICYVIFQHITLTLINFNRFLFKNIILTSYENYFRMRNFFVCSKNLLLKLSSIVLNCFYTCQI